jgi:hypothetical protein
LSLSFAKTMSAAMISGVMTFSAFLVRSFAKQEERKVTLRQASR